MPGRKFSNTISGQSKKPLDYNNLEPVIKFDDWLDVQFKDDSDLNQKTDFEAKINNAETTKEKDPELEDLLKFDDDGIESKETVLDEEPKPEEELENISFGPEFDDIFKNDEEKPEVKEQKEISQEKKTKETSKKESKGLENPDKTMTDLFSEGQNENQRLAELVEKGFLRDQNGYPYPKAPTPEETLKLITSDMDSDKPVYAQSPNGKVFRIAKTPENGFFRAFQEKPEKGSLVDPAVKANMIDELKKMQGEMAKTNITRGNLREFVSLKNTLDKTIKTLETTVFKKTFDTTVENLANVAGTYFQKNVKLKPSKKRGTLDMCSKIKVLTEAAKNDRVPEKTAMSEAEMKRREIAARAVASFAKTHARSNDPEKKSRAEAILADEAAFSKELDLALNSKAFQMFFGSEKNPVDMATLEAGLKAKGSNIEKMVQNKSLELKNAARTRTAKGNSREALAGIPKMSQEMKDDIASSIESLGKELDALGNGKSPEFKAFKDKVNQARRLLKNPSNFTNYARIAALIGDAADKYGMHKFDKGINRKGAKRLLVADKFRALADNVSKGKLPSENMPTKEDLRRLNIAEKIAHEAAKKMTKSKTESEADRGRTILEDRFAFNEQVKNVLNGEGFKLVYNDKDIDLYSELRSNTKSILKKIGERQAAELKKQEKEKEALEKENKKKIKEKEALEKKKDQGLSLN